MIANNKAGGNSVQVPEMDKIHAAGSPKRSKANGPKKTLHYEMKVAYFQEAHASVTVFFFFEKKSNGSKDIQTRLI